MYRICETGLKSFVANRVAADVSQRLEELV
jgi:hypothetical protein